MKKTLSVLLAFAAFGSVGCSDDGPTTVQLDPQARVRYFNASPDSPAIEAVFVDRVENTFSLRGLTFRASSGEYQAVNSGERRLRVFRALSAGTVDTAQAVVLDTTFTLDTDARYTIVQYGNARAEAGSAGSAKIVLFADTLPETPATGFIAVRTYHVIPGAGNVDVSIAPISGATVGAAVSGGTNIPVFGRSAYVTLPVRPAADTASYYQFRVTPTGAAAPVLVTAVPTVPGLPAVAATATSAAQDPTAGVRQSGSIMSAFIVPPVAGTATSTPTVILAPDQPPPRISP